MRKLWLLLFFFPLFSAAQIDTKRVMMVGQNALYYDDYVLSIQYFNQVIEVKPFLSEPYYLRGLAKFFLEDYRGTVEDCDSSIVRNPFIKKVYQLRGLCRIKINDIDGALEDYRKVVKEDSMVSSAWHNMALCYLQLNKYESADSLLIIMNKLFPHSTETYVLRAQISLIKKDTTFAMSLLDEALENDSLASDVCALKAIILLKTNDYQGAETNLNIAIKGDEKNAMLYVNRALTYYYLNNLRSAMSDYDKAIELNPNYYLAHYNRALLRTQIGDDNRAIEDFDFVLNKDSANLMAIFNRALLFEKTGNYKQADYDLSKILKVYPNFLYGYEVRSKCRRILGNKKGANEDLNKIYVAQLDYLYGNHKKRSKVKKTRKWSDSNLDNYQDIAVADNDTTVDYVSDYRGKIQNKKVEIDFLLSYGLTFNKDSIRLRDNVNFIPSIDLINKKDFISQKIYFTNEVSPNSSEDIKKLNNSVKELGNKLLEPKYKNNLSLLFLRGLGYLELEDFASASKLFNLISKLDSTFALTYLVQSTMYLKKYKVNHESLSTLDRDLEIKAILSNLDKVGELSPILKKYVYYNKGCVYLLLNSNKDAYESFGKAIEEDDDFADAYYNRGLVALKFGEIDECLNDLSRAGELGLYQSYSLIKQISKRSPKKLK